MIGKKFIYIYKHGDTDYYWNSEDGGVFVKDSTLAEAFTSNQFFTLGKGVWCEPIKGNIVLIKYPEKKYVS